MLKKLFGYEWKAFWKVPTLIAVTFLVMSLLASAMFIMPEWTNEYTLINLLKMLFFSFYYMAIIGLNFFLLVWIALRFYKNLYTDEGYLMHTLPVTPHQLILSKLFVSGIWEIIYSIILCIGIGNIFLFVFISSDMQAINWQDVMRGIGTLITEFEQSFGCSILVTCLTVGLYLFMSLVFSIMVIYASISLGQLCKKHRVIGAIIVYLISTVIMQVVVSIIFFMNALPSLNSSSNVTMASIFGPSIYLIILFEVVIFLLCYFVSYYMMNRKLNLE
ncbi:MAG: hypothetical protein PHP50_01005 [Lachnospiraceae bacterium]|nr:hypothetical protein [Lachnospiraceae bacterium]